MNIVVTGSTGFIGRHLTNYLAKNQENKILALCNHLPESKDRFEHSNIELWYYDLSKPNLDFIKSYKPDIVYHVASSSNPSFNTKQSWNDNTLITINLLENINCPVIFTSTANILGEYPHDKDQITTIYAASKRANECIIECYFRQHKIPAFRSYRLCGVVGPNMTHGLVLDIINKLKNDSPKLVLLKNTLKTYIHIDDLLPILCKPINNGNFIIENIGASSYITAQEVAMICMNELKIQKPIEFTNISYRGDIEKSYIHMSSGISSQEAIRKAVKSYL